MITDAEYLYRKRQEAERAEKTGRLPNLDVGKVWVEENGLSRIGALTYIRRRQPHHERAAERFKNEYERLYGAGNPAMDPSRIQVDTSPIAHDSGMAARVDRGRSILEVIYGIPATAERAGVPAVLSPRSAQRVIASIVLEEPCQSMAVSDSRKDRDEAVELLLADLDTLAVFWGYLARVAA